MSNFKMSAFAIYDFNRIVLDITFKINRLRTLTHIVLTLAKDENNFIYFGTYKSHL